MTSKLTTRTLGAALTAVMLIISAGAFEARAEKPIASQLDIEEVRSYLGPWKLVLKAQGFEFELILTISDVDGKVGATLDSAQSPEPLAITNIARGAEGGLDMNSELSFGPSFKIDINIAVTLVDDKLVGTIKDKGGLLSSPVEGVRVTQEELDSVQGRRPPATEARMRIGEKMIRIGFASLSTEGPDWETLQNLKQGEVFEFTSSRATKIYTDFDLGFGDVTVEAENMAKGYPGVYSIWLKKTEDGWSMVFNEQADIWGTRRIAEHDSVEVPLELSTVEGDAQKKYVIKLEEAGEGKGVLTMTWGNLKWTADFVLDQS